MTASGTLLAPNVRQPQLPGEAPGPVAALELTATADSVTVTWQPPEAGDAPERYMVHVKPQGSRTGSGKTKNPKANKLTSQVCPDLVKCGLRQRHYLMWWRRST